MTKTKQRIKDFSSGLKKLSDESQNYICNLTHILFFVGQLLVHSIAGKKIINNAKK